MPRRSQRRITKRTVDALRIRKKDYIVWDRDLPGFGVRVLKSGRKVFVVQARGPGGSKRLSIGPYGELTVPQVRNRAAAHIERIKRGANPVPAPPPEQLTVAELADRYLRFHANVNCADSTVELYRGVIDNHIVPALGEQAINSVERSDLLELQYALHDTPGAANITVQVLTQMFYKAEQWGLLAEGANPCRAVRKYRLQQRERYLTQDEYRRLGKVLALGETDGSLAESAVAALRVLILTGCRREEVLGLRWDDIDFQARELRLHDSKTGPCMVALTSPVEAVLKGVPRLVGNPWVFAGEQPGRRRMTLKSTWRQVTARAGIRGVRVHDLRHSYASRALALGESLTMIGKLLNHAQINTTARYSHLMRDAEKDAAARIGDAIGSHLGT